MVRIIVGAEKHPQSNKPLSRAMPKHMAIDQAIAQAAMHTANNMPGVKAIVCLTETGLNSIAYEPVRHALARVCVLSS